MAEPIFEYPPGHGLKRLALPPADSKLPAVAECDCGVIVTGANSQLCAEAMRMHVEEIHVKHQERFESWLTERRSDARSVLGIQEKERRDHWIPEPFETRPH